MLALTLGARFVHVPYRSGGQQVQAIHQGQGQWGWRCWPRRPGRSAAGWCARWR
ncbi:hypothetical protein [Teichococcus aestuarii]|uniref:hypothetical protein n=1 Tax=Teichococcus aestuarii TaxID=568898 RepID=UPI00361306A3